MARQYVGSKNANHFGRKLTGQLGGKAARVYKKLLLVNAVKVNDQDLSGHVYISTLDSHDTLKTISILQA